MRKRIRTFLALAACALLLYGGLNLFFYLLQSGKSASANQNLISMAVAVKPEDPAPEETSQTPAETEAQEEPQQTWLDEIPPITVDFDVLQAQSQDVVGWLYCEDTPINLPICQGKDNDYYLYHLYDGTGNSSGTLFIDYRSPRDFSAGNTVIYGHNMKNRTMFGSISNYRKQEYYDTHPVLWLLTPQQDYKLEPVVGVVTPDVSEIFSYELSCEQAYDLVTRLREDSTFQTDIRLQPTDRFVSLSTCSYEFDEARYVVIARMLPLRPKV